MFGARAIAICILLGSCGAWGQSAAPQPAFEVASIKPAPPQAPGRVSIGMSTDGARLIYTNVSLSDVIWKAYRVKPNQITGPPWLDTERFDIAARIPAGTATTLVPEMLQALLADRFRLTLHRETKELPVYVLVAGKNEPKAPKAESSGGLSIGVSAARAHITGNVSMSVSIGAARPPGAR
jgi:uncharacterized protein (TIGR03435 family)